jgi:hypothetical protein
VAKLDGRTHDGRLMRDARQALIEHCGGAPSVTQRMLIDRVVALAVHLARMDRKAIEAGEMALHASNQYIAWSNCLTRTLRALGTKPGSSTADPHAIIAALNARRPETD